MKCGFFDLACHVQSSAWEWWSGVGFLNKSLIVLGLVALIVGVSWSLLSFIKRVGGWPAVIGAVAVIVGLVLAILPRKPKDTTFTGEVDGPDAKGPFQFGKDRVKPPKKRKSIKLPDNRPGTWNRTTGSWNE